MNIAVKIDLPIERLGDLKVMSQVERTMVRAATRIFVPLARAEAPSRSGAGRRLIRSTVFRAGPNWIGRVYAGKAFWLRILATGTVAYQIMTRRARAGRRPAALRFQSGGGPVYRAQVNRRALRARDIFGNARRRGEGAALAEAERVLTEALNG